MNLNRDEADIGQVSIIIKVREQRSVQQESQSERRRQY